MASESAKIIAHRGACGYLPEHTLPAKALAYGMGADYLEQDVVASRDGALLVLHDLYLEAVSNVADVYPDRARDDGHYYCVDFDLDEIRTLEIRERIDPATGEMRYPGRFPRDAGSFRAHTLEEEVRFIDGLNRATGRAVGIYPEIKNPAWHREQGIDLSKLMLEALDGLGYLRKKANIYLQCFDSNELKRVKAEAGGSVPLVQLLGSQPFVEQGEDAEARQLGEIAAYARGIGPPIKLIYGGNDASGNPRRGELIGLAHDAGLVVHPYTFRVDRLPDDIGDFEALLNLIVVEMGADGLFTDFPDRAATFLRGA